MQSNVRTCPPEEHSAHHSARPVGVIESEVGPQSAVLLAPIQTLGPLEDING